MISHRCLPWGLYLQLLFCCRTLSICYSQAQGLTCLSAIDFWKLSEPHRFTRINLDQSNNRGASTT
jgi:hypothetical protein